MDILIIAHFCGDFSRNDNGRFLYLAKSICDKHQVEIVTSNFNHTTKRIRGKDVYTWPFKITLINEPRYKKNISLKRFYSHWILSKNLNKYLMTRKIPDVLYVAVPSLDVASVAVKYANRNNIRLIIDIQDLWPEAFKMVFRIPVLSDLVFLPMKRKADKIYALADEVVAVSDTYAKRAMRVNKKCKAATVVYLGTEKANFDQYAKIAAEKYVGVTIAYVGSMSASYDLKSVIDAMSKMKSNSIKLLAMGDGALRTEFTEYAKEKGVNAEFTGKLIYPQMVERLLQCDIAVNPIHKGSAGSILNKVGDYAMAGLPVINTQENQEYRDLLIRYQAGINCECENSDEIAVALKTLVADSQLRAKMSSNARRLGEERFDRKNIYRNLVDLLLNVGGGVIKLAYCGTLGHSYDIGCVIEAIRELNAESRNRIYFIVMGAGPKQEEFVRQAKDLPVIFTGRLLYPEMVWVLSHCDIAVNPISKGAAQSIINKHMDYAMAGLPVINTEESLEYRGMIEKYNCGINCRCENVEDVKNAIETLMYNPGQRILMGKNSRRMAEELFDRAVTYVKTKQLILNGET